MEYGYNPLMTPVDGVASNVIPGQPPIGSALNASPNTAPSATNPTTSAGQQSSEHTASAQTNASASAPEDVVASANDATVSDPSFASPGVDHTMQTEAAFADDDYQNARWKLRSIVSSKEAGIIIGKAGKNVAELRDATGVKAGVSKVVRGVQNRVLTVEGQLMGIAKAYGFVANGLAQANVAMPPTAGMGMDVQPSNPSISLLISHNQMGTIIGRQGVKIKYIQDASGVRMVAQKDMLPCSTERVVELRGTPEGIEKAVWEIGKCLIDDRDRYAGTIEYNPTEAETRGYATSPSYDQYTRTGNGADFSERPQAARPRNSDTPRMGLPQMTEDGKEYEIQNVSIPSDMAGCIIGRGGKKVGELRREAGANISIAKEGGTGVNDSERLISVSGSNEAVQKALRLLYETLEMEKVRRMNEAQIPQGQE